MSRRGRLVGINHVALEVGDLDAALEFYGRVFDFELRGSGPGGAFLDMGDQFLALSERTGQPPDKARHFGLVSKSPAVLRGMELGALVKSPEAVRELEKKGLAERSP